MKKGVGILILGLLSVISCKKKNAALFQKLDVAHTQIIFSNTLKPTTELNILTYLYYYNGAGVAAGDFNNDGLVDLYFTANQEADHLYLNKGGLQFEEVTKKSGIENASGWTTGVTHVDINNDGWLDIYVCKVGQYKNLKGKNLLFVNQGTNAAGIPTFKEEAEKYNLDFSGFSTQSTFFDYDLDGDLDMYLLNHSVNPNRSYGKGGKRKQIDSLSGDVLFRNDGNHFTDVSKEAGIFQGSIGYGLGLGVSDLNNDGYPDIYVGNDFFENDYLYLNQKEGTFKEIISQDDKKLGHTTHFSMGNDIADINNDGLPDLLSLDMLPENLETYKTAGLEYPYPIYRQYLNNGFAPQYMQNTLHLNLGGANFSEIAHLSGVAATEWSWGALLADYDNDGHKDLFVSNGIKGATNDMDFISFIANDEIQSKIEAGMTQEEMAFIKQLPEKKVHNYFFKNDGALSFKDVTTEWIAEEKSFSNGCTYADLDNDGDLDIVVNNVDQEAFILENRAEINTKNNFLKIQFKGNTTNLKGIGAKIIAYTPKGTLTQENYVTRGYLSAVPSYSLLGMGNDSLIDSLNIVWPGGAYETLTNVKAGNLEVNEKNAQGNFYLEQSRLKAPYFVNRDSVLTFFHSEKATIEFDRDPLVPFTSTNEGPAISVEDINGDGLEDFFISGPKREASALFLQTLEGQFVKEQREVFDQDSFNEDVDHVFLDANNDGAKDLIVVSGGNEFKSSEKIQPRLYINQNGTFTKQTNAFEGVELNASKVTAVDFDKDGDMDLAMASDQVPHQFGKTPVQYLFKNNGKAQFEDVTDSVAPHFKSIGNVKDLFWVDLDDNGFQDLIAVGHWMPISIFMNDGKTLTLKKNDGLEKTHGLWNTIDATDFDGDGDIDLLVGNWGLNSKLRATFEEPLKLYSDDFDNNGSVEPLVTYFHRGRETPFASKDELVKQMPFLNKNFLSYQSFAKASLQELFGAKNLREAYTKKVHELASCYFRNNGDASFTKIELPKIAQASTVHDMLFDDFDKDGRWEVLLVGNTYEISTQLGRMDASHGVLLRFCPNGFEWASDINIDVPGPARSLEKIQIGTKQVYIIGINNSEPLFLERIDNE